MAFVWPLILMDDVSVERVLFDRLATRSFLCPDRTVTITIIDEKYWISYEIWMRVNLKRWSDSFRSLWLCVSYINDNYSSLNLNRQCSMNIYLSNSIVSRQQSCLLPVYTHEATVDLSLSSMWHGQIYDFDQEMNINIKRRIVFVSWNFSWTTLINTVVLDPWRNESNVNIMTIVTTTDTEQVCFHHHSFLNETRRLKLHSSFVDRWSLLNQSFEDVRYNEKKTYSPTRWLPSINDRIRSYFIFRCKLRCSFSSLSHVDRDSIDKSVVFRSLLAISDR
jgi:hypothetical protein